MKRQHPQHVTLRVTPQLGELRRFDTYIAIRYALRVVLSRASAFRIVHFSVQSTHVHLLVEANDKKALANGLRAFEISAARQLNAVWSRRMHKRRRGQVFCDRYDAEDLGSPTQTRNALSYVLNNWRKHKVAPSDRSGLDPFASGRCFNGWRETIPAPPSGYIPPALSAPRTWFLAESWKRVRPISVFDIPGPRSART